MAELVLPKEIGIPALKDFGMFHYVPMSPDLEQAIFNETLRRLGGETKLAKISARVIDEMLVRCGLSGGERLCLIPRSGNRFYLTMRICSIDPQMKTAEITIRFPIEKADWSVGWGEENRDWRPIIIEDIIVTWGFKGMWVKRHGGSDATMVVSLRDDNSPRAIVIPNAGDNAYNSYYVTEKEWRENSDLVNATVEKIRKHRLEFYGAC